MVEIEEESGNDLISCLSDDLLRSIISFLLVGDAMSTSLLSTRWRGLWKSVLPTTVKHGRQEDISREIGYFLDDVHENGLFGYEHGLFVSELYLLGRSDRRQLKHFKRLRFDFGHGCFLLATAEAVGTLHLDFYSENRNQSQGWDWHLAKCSSPIGIGTSKFPPPPCHFINTLHLISVTNVTSETVSSIFSRFMFLQRLIIEDCQELHSLHIDANSALSNLTISNCSQLKSLHINAYGLRKFMFISLGMVDVRGGPADPFKHSNSLLSAMADVEVLTLCRWTFEAAIRPWLGSTEFSRLKELRWLDYSVNEDKIDTLLFFLSICPFLQKLYINIDPRRCSSCYTSKYREYVSEQVRLDDLSFIKLEGEIKKEEQILLEEMFRQRIVRKTESLDL